MEALKIWLLCIAAAIVYGIVHDQITVRICYEYFSVFHPRLLPVESPTLLGLQWGVVATWWVGAALGVALAVAARGGSRPPRAARDLQRPIGVLLVCMAAGATIAGAIGFLFANQGWLSTDWLSRLPGEKGARFMADWWAHSASYLVGIVGGLIVCIQTYLRRSPKTPAPAPVPPPVPA